MEATCKCPTLLPALLTLGVINTYSTRGYFMCQKMNAGQEETRKNALNPPETSLTKELNYFVA